MIGFVPRKYQILKHYENNINSEWVYNNDIESTQIMIKISDIRLLSIYIDGVPDTMRTNFLMLQDAGQYIMDLCDLHTLKLRANVDYLTLYNEQMYEFLCNYYDKFLAADILEYMNLRYEVIIIRNERQRQYKIDNFIISDCYKYARYNITGRLAMPSYIMLYTIPGANEQIKQEIASSEILCDAERITNNIHLNKCGHAMLDTSVLHYNKNVWIISINTSSDRCTADYVDILLKVNFLYKQNIGRSIYIALFHEV